MDENDSITTVAKVETKFSRDKDGNTRLHIIYEDREVCALTADESEIVAAVLDYFLQLNHAALGVTAETEVFHIEEEGP
jgi:hypothetical protein